RIINFIPIVFYGVKDALSGAAALGWHVVEDSEAHVNQSGRMADPTVAFNGQLKAGSNLHQGRAASQETSSGLQGAVILLSPETGGPNPTISPSAAATRAASARTVPPGMLQNPFNGPGRPRSEPVTRPGPNSPVPGPPGVRPAPKTGASFGK